MKNGYAENGHRDILMIGVRLQTIKKSYVKSPDASRVICLKNAGSLSREVQ